MRLIHLDDMDGTRRDFLLLLCKVILLRCPTLPSVGLKCAVTLGALVDYWFLVVTISLFPSASNPQVRATGSDGVVRSYS